MAKTNKNEKDELMEKVFGKDAPNRSLNNDDIKILEQASNSFNEQLDALLKRTNETNSQLNEMIDKANEVLVNTNKITQMNQDADLETIRKQIISDYGIEAANESVVNITYNQVELSEKFKEIEEELNKSIVAQSEYLSGLCKAFRRPLVMGKQSSGLNTSILISGQKNTGRHSSVKLICKLMKDKAVLNNAEISFIDLSKYQSKEDENNFIIDLYGAISKGSIIVFENIESCAASYLSYMEQILLEAKLSLNKRYVLNNKQLVETSTTLASNTISELDFSGKYLIYISTLKKSKLLNVLGSRFVNSLADIIETSSFDETEIVELYENKLVDFKTRVLTCLNVNLICDDKLEEFVKDNYDGSNGKYINDFLEKLYAGISEYKIANPSDDTLDGNVSVKDDKITFNDNPLDTYTSDDVDNIIEEVKKELDNLVGLKEIKDYIYSLQDFYQAQKLKQAQGINVSEISKHMIFTGNPGTGKTTIARLLAKYLKAIGVLSNGQLIEVTRNDLVGKYVGHTAPQTMQVINSAIGGVLFIDEAYSLYRSENDSFGLECIDTLVKAMEDNRDNLIVILAGYTKEMKVFLESNSGLKSRFPVQMEFPDYTGEELYQIAVINAKSSGYIIEEEVKQPLTDYFTKIQKDDNVRSGNGRLARNVIEKAIIKQSTRILNDNGQLDQLKLEDFDLE